MVCRWHEGGWPTLEAAVAAYREVIFETLADWTRAWGDTPFEYVPVDEKYDDALEWLVEGSGWNPYGFCVIPDGRGNFRFAAVCYRNVHPFSVRKALHGDFTPPRVFNPDKPFEGITT